ncbi:PRD domain-containing protein [Hydrogenoanaerobacterium sp.]|uniref:PRD domain-containing protein n=1 Tax=Hydrogenoanaerobacterium sp. TaxID=2953763 RepID=UPI0028A0AB13|nr:PRD domain-containing protein [Hydrogenoanaerobacterium sp.]
MNYKAVKVFNNNVILAEEEDGKQVVLISKGIGFGVKKGEQITAEGDDKKVFYILDENVNAGEIKRLSYDIEKVEQVTQGIVQIAREKLDITSEKLYDALYDHISFAIERLKMGLPIDNPFIGEISIMCNKEYEVAENAASLIKEQMDVDIGDAEKGFIALHLYSARRNKHINVAMKSARVFKQAVIMVENRFNRTFNTNSSACKSFLMSLNRLVDVSAKQKPLEMPIKQHVKLYMYEYDEVAQAIARMIKSELGVEFSEDAKAFLAVNICKFIQM